MATTDRQRQLNTANMRRWRLRNPDKAKASNDRYRAKHRERILKYLRGKHFQRKFGISAEQADAMVAAAKVCGICERPFKNRQDAHIDHDHSDGRIRGILCGPCNRKMGWYDKFTEGVARYLAAVKR